MQERRRPEERRRSENRRIRIGAGLLMALALLAATVFFLDEVLDSFRPTTRLVITTGQPTGVSSGGEVRVAGRRGGRITDVRFVSSTGEGAGRRAIDVELTREAARLLREDATAHIGSPTLLGTPVIDIEPGSREAGPLDPTDTLAAREIPDREELRAHADALRAELDTLAPLVEKLLVRLREGPGTVAALRRDTALLRSLGASAEASAELRERARRGTLARLMADDSLHAALGRLLDLAGRTSDPARPGEVTPADLRESLRELGGRLERVEADLEGGEGTLGRVLRDDALRRELRLLRARTDSLKTELAEDPLRWLGFRLF